jgi:hypothetical protein
VRWVGKNPESFREASLIPKAFGMRVEAFFCLDFLFLFHLRKKKEEKKEMTYPIANLIAS